MRIAQVSPLYESVPPKCYGGTERVVAYLTEELVRLGHDVTLFASGDSVTSAKLVPGAPQALRLSRCIDPLAHHFRMMEEVFRRADDFDIVHFHIDYMHFPISRRLGIPNVTTLHGRLDIPDLVPLYREFDDMPLVSISDAQREPLPWVDWQATVYHGLPWGLYRLEETPGDYLAFLGRISPEKRVDRAIEIARRAGMELRIAAKIDRVDREYFHEKIEHLFRLPHVTYIGEIGEGEKQEFLGNARALLFPIDWPEPVGLVMVESMACGTPVVAFRGGSVEEIIDDGVTGFVCDDLDQAVAAVDRAAGLSRRCVRDRFEQRFTVTRMACDYLRLYQRLAETSTHNGRDHTGPGTVLHSRLVPPRG